ncbi:RNA polymerase sigma factor [Pseudoalteromonas tunicata]|jgi:RNA polymerase sigma-70 factor (ECF subfamily)|uniref:Putative RNA polymerase sigma factor n=1 Tax=Pseudoalteromonas tunicata D2 TaxID=87626 RepID=A4C8P8_9GAMM|nr:sigma-70 family RNA polymerase sigma factor [Pseudoalteromonas tunicata]ATC93465.1 RNA polymerase sigma-70 factor, ECF subfamily [Pseudoalteromonas tunicata]AXT32506.1 sigma-70 family RNA polymerase sigma factor [Pseudoalteromonas tunicata]EAR28963.1 putative RNA polymerase sigma factor [Pseudoalteromonas tunicata D2]MDP4983004.1 sigma-70 family RNA polymerase sigma factor [Pseudoalteromonas tunicata]MDP5211736.1 sigma-70 family RNA polymerase sigma factor [Pseudoalteromonas tunicata]
MLIEAEQRFSSEQEAKKRDEQQLIDQTKQGDQRAFAKLYQLHHKKVYGLCLRLTANEAFAQEATQEVFVQLWQKISSFDGSAKFSTWLHSVTANIAISYMRKQISWLQRVVSFETEGMPEQAVEQCEGLNGLDKLIVRLPERARLVFVLHAVEGYRHEEIGHMLNMAVGSSKSQYHRARNLLQEWYQNEQTE